MVAVPFFAGELANKGTVTISHNALWQADRHEGKW
jgi:hypothetical protein